MLVVFPYAAEKKDMKDISLIFQGQHEKRDATEIVCRNLREMFISDIR